jgi:GH43 family beta-xylosidase
MKKMILFLFIIFSFPVLIFGGNPKKTTYKLSDIHIRDPFIVPDSATGKYYLYASIANRTCMPDSMQGVEAYSSKDLINWTGPKQVFIIPKKFWAHKLVWAPEVHKYNGKYYLFVTFTSKDSLPPVAGRPKFDKRGTQILVSNSLTGPFKPFHNHSVTPVDWMALDGTLWVEKNQPYIIFSHEWIQTTNGTIELAPLKKDLSAIEKKPVTLFKAGDAAWVADLNIKMDDGIAYPCYVTDGPFLYKTSNGTLLMIWSSFDANKKYCIGIARSLSGSILGPWKQDDKPLLNEDGGHSMIFKTFDGKLMLSFHRPNNDPDERAYFVELNDTGDNIVLKNNK